MTELTQAQQLRAALMLATEQVTKYLSLKQEATNWGMALNEEVQNLAQNQDPARVAGLEYAIADSQKEHELAMQERDQARHELLVASVALATLLQGADTDEGAAVLAALYEALH